MADVVNVDNKNADGEKVNGDRKVLLSVRNLKQYFPVKNSKTLFVKANDGISLDIYEGETLGVVGESGCGKSTLGRVLLQLYNQTEGETMYYGRTLDSLAPSYAMNIYKNLSSRCKEAKDLEKKALEAVVAYKALEQKASVSNDTETERKLYHALEEMNKAKRHAESMQRSICELAGGFYAVDDIEAVSRLYVNYYNEVIQKYKMSATLEALTADIKDLKDKMAMEQNEGKKDRFQSKISAIVQKAEKQKIKIKAQEEVIANKYSLIERLREQYKDDPEFARYESYRDEGINLSRLTYNELRQLRRDLQLIFQDPYSSLNPRMTVGQIIGEGLLTHKFYKTNNKAMQEYIMATMESCGLAPYMLHRYPHQFSGGQRQRIGIARSLAVNPKFVVCDEAVSALDVSIQSQIINLLMDLKEKDNLTYMFISHDLSVVKYISDRIAVMYLGNIVELASAEEMFKCPLHPYTESLLLAIPTTDPDQKKELAILEGDIPSPVNPPSGCKFHTRCRYCMDICKEVTPEFKEFRKGHFVACHYRDR